VNATAHDVRDVNDALSREVGIPRITARFHRDTGMELADGLVMLCYVGSISHGTHRPPAEADGIDDIDLMGVYVPPLRYTLGLGSFEHWVVKEDELDITLYSLKKFVGLVLKSNPNVLGTLWLKPEHYLVSTRAWHEVLNERAIFSSLHAYDAFTGYGHAQLKKMAATQRYEGYMGQKRRELVDRFGYDVKNAAHLIRLMRMCAEFLADGELRVFREHDADELVRIKRGEWTVREVETEAERLFALASELRDKSELPRYPDHKRADALVQRIHLGTYDLVPRPVGAAA
jgi:uncharacterized protein